jgi:RNA recognition motif-containing protein
VLTIASSLSVLGSKPEDLRRIFEAFGVVTECDIMNRCGFIHMATQEQADAAINALNNSLFNGVNIVVERGRMKDRKPPGGGLMQNNNGPPIRNSQMRGGNGMQNRNQNRDGPMQMRPNQMGNNNQQGGFRGELASSSSAFFN